VNQTKQQENVMNELTKITPALDGFEIDDSEGSNIIKGAKIKFTLDFKWVVARSGEVIDPQRKFLILEILRVEQKWLPDQIKPKTRALGAGEPFPNFKKLNKDAPSSEWREKFGKRVGPYQGAHVVYLLEIDDASKKVAVFTWVADTEGAGASRAIKELRETTQLTRRVQGNLNLYPCATLSDTFMPTQYGGRQRPHFNVLHFEALGPTQEAPAQIEHAKPKQAERIEQKVDKRTASKPSKAEPDFDDDINL
jgi:hypothetical protein